MILGYRALEVLETAGTAFLGISAMLGASFVFYRSRLAALYVAVGGAGLVLATAFQYVLGQSNLASILHGSLRLLMSVSFIGGHALFFGGLALAMREIARGGPR